MRFTLIFALLSIFAFNVQAAVDPSWELITTFENPEGYEETRVRTGLQAPEVVDIYKQPTLVFAEMNALDERHIYIAAVDQATYDEAEVLIAEAAGDPIVYPDPIPDPPIELDPNLITQENIPPAGDFVEVSDEPDFSVYETLVFSQFINGDGETAAGNPSGFPAGTPYVITIVANDGDANYSYWQYGRTVEQPVVDPIPDPVPVTVLVINHEGTFEAPVDWDGEDVTFSVSNATDLFTAFYTHETGETFDYVSGLEQDYFFSKERIVASGLTGRVQFKIGSGEFETPEAVRAYAWINIPEPVVVPDPTLPTVITFNNSGSYSSPTLWEGQDITFTVENLAELKTEIYLAGTQDVLDVVDGIDQDRMFSAERINSLGVHGSLELVVSNGSFDGTVVGEDYFEGSTWIYIPAPVIDPVLCSTSKDQLRGLLTQLNNLMDNGNDVVKANTSFTNLYGKVDEIRNELCVIKRLVDDSDLP